MSDSAAAPGAGPAPVPIATLTLNPAVDLSASVARVVAGPKLRCSPPVVEPGGGGVNVARVVTRFGGACSAVVAVGGTTGQILLDLLAAEGCPTRPIYLSGTTRQSLAVTETESGKQFRFVLPGPPPVPEDIRAVEDRLEEALPPGGIAVLSGSMPEGWPCGTLDRLRALAAQRGTRLVADVSGAALGHLMAATDGALYLLRLDAGELEAERAEAAVSVGAAAGVARRLVAQGVARMIAVGRRAEGSLLVTGDDAWFCSAPPSGAPVLSPVGAGDALVGAMVWRMAAGDPPEQALRWGVAAAAATVATPGTALCTLAEATALLDGCTLSAL